MNKKNILNTKKSVKNMSIIKSEIKKADKQDIITKILWFYIPRGNVIDWSFINEELHKRKKKRTIK